jgi:hypothetical protein
MSFFPKKQTTEPQNIDEVLAQFNELKEECVSLKNEVQKLRKENVKMVDKIGIVRFNPFEGLGSNQSFSLAILDGNNNGAVITSLFSREANRVYGKPINLGTSEFKLAEEEKQAIEIARSKSKVQSSNIK